MNGTFVVYYRVSTDRQGVRGLGMEAQERAVNDYLNGGDWTVLESFREVESGKRSDRPELMKAIKLAKDRGAKLLIAKLDRLSRDVHFLSGLEKQGVEFVAADMPTANRFTVHIMAAVAQQEREMISARTTTALESIRERIEADGHYVTREGKTITRLGGPKPITADTRQKSLEARQRASANHAAIVRPIIATLRQNKLPLQAVADHLNHLGHKTPRGGHWTAIAVSRIEKKQLPE